MAKQKNIVQDKHKKKRRAILIASIVTCVAGSLATGLILDAIYNKDHSALKQQTPTKFNSNWGVSIQKSAQITVGDSVSLSCTFPVETKNPNNISYVWYVSPFSTTGIVPESNWKIPNSNSNHFTITPTLLASISHGNITPQGLSKTTTIKAWVEVTQKEGTKQTPVTETSNPCAITINPIWGSILIPASASVNPGSMLTITGQQVNNFNLTNVQYTWLIDNKVVKNLSTIPSTLKYLVPAVLNVKSLTVVLKVSADYNGLTLSRTSNNCIVSLVNSTSTPSLSLPNAVTAYSNEQFSVNSQILNVSASQEKTLTPKWIFNGKVYTGSDCSINQFLMTAPNVSKKTTYTLQLQLIDSNGQVYLQSNVCTISVQLPQVLFTKTLYSQTAGKNITFNVKTNGFDASAPISYQWKIAGANNYLFSQTTSTGNLTWQIPLSCLGDYTVSAIVTQTLNNHIISASATTTVDVSKITNQLQVINWPQNAAILVSNKQVSFTPIITGNLGQVSYNWSVLVNNSSIFSSNHKILSYIPNVTNPTNAILELKVLAPGQASVTKTLNVTLLPALTITSNFSANNFPNGLTIYKNEAFTPTINVKNSVQYGTPVYKWTFTPNNAKTINYPNQDANAFTGTIPNQNTQNVTGLLQVTVSYALNENSPFTETITGSISNRITYSTTNMVGNVNFPVSTYNVYAGQSFKTTAITADLPTNLTWHWTLTDNQTKQVTNLNGMSLQLVTEALPSVPGTYTLTISATALNLATKKPYQVAASTTLNVIGLNPKLQITNQNPVYFATQKIAVTTKTPNLLPETTVGTNFTWNKTAISLDDGNFVLPQYNGSEVSYNNSLGCEFTFTNQYGSVSVNKSLNVVVLPLAEVTLPNQVIIPLNSAFNCKAEVNDYLNTTLLPKNIPTPTIAYTWENQANSANYQFIPTEAGSTSVSLNATENIQIDGQTYSVSLQPQTMTIQTVNFKNNYVVQAPWTSSVSSNNTYDLSGYENQQLNITNYLLSNWSSYVSNSNINETINPLTSNWTLNVNGTTSTISNNVSLSWNPTLSGTRIIVNNLTYNLTLTGLKNCSVNVKNTFNISITEKFTEASVSLPQTLNIYANQSIGILARGTNVPNGTKWTWSWSNASANSGLKNGVIAGQSSILYDFTAPNVQKDASATLTISATLLNTETNKNYTISASVVITILASVSVHLSGLNAGYFTGQTLKIQANATTKYGQIVAYEWSWNGKAITSSTTGNINELSYLVPNYNEGSINNLTTYTQKLSVAVVVQTETGAILFPATTYEIIVLPKATLSNIDCAVPNGTQSTFSGFINKNLNQQYLPNAVHVSVNYSIRGDITNLPAFSQNNDDSFSFIADALYTGITGQITATESATINGQTFTITLTPAAINLTFLANLQVTITNNNSVQWLFKTSSTENGTNMDPTITGYAGGNGLDILNNDYESNPWINYLKANYGAIVNNKTTIGWRLSQESKTIITSLQPNFQDKNITVGNYLLSSALNSTVEFESGVIVDTNITGNFNVNVLALPQISGAFETANSSYLVNSITSNNAINTKFTLKNTNASATITGTLTNASKSINEPLTIANNQITTPLYNLQSGVYTLTINVKDTLYGHTESISFSKTITVIQQVSVNPAPTTPIKIDVGQNMVYQPVINGNTSSGSLSYAWYQTSNAVTQNELEDQINSLTPVCYTSQLDAPASYDNVQQNFYYSLIITQTVNGYSSKVYLLNVTFQTQVFNVSLSNTIFYLWNNETKTSNVSVNNALQNISLSVSCNIAKISYSATSLTNGLLNVIANTTQEQATANPTLRFAETFANGKSIFVTVTIKITTAPKLVISNQLPATLYLWANQQFTYTPKITFENTDNSPANGVYTWTSNLPGVTSSVNANNFMVTPTNVAVYELSLTYQIPNFPAISESCTAHVISYTSIIAKASILSVNKDKAYLGQNIQASYSQNQQLSALPPSVMSSTVGSWVWEASSNNIQSQLTPSSSNPNVCDYNGYLTSKTTTSITQGSFVANLNCTLNPNTAFAQTNNPSVNSIELQSETVSFYPVPKITSLSLENVPQYISNATYIQNYSSATTTIQNQTLSNVARRANVNANITWTSTISTLNCTYQWYWSPTANWDSSNQNVNFESTSNPSTVITSASFNSNVNVSYYLVLVVSYTNPITNKVETVHVVNSTSTTLVAAPIVNLKTTTINVGENVTAQIQGTTNLNQEYPSFYSYWINPLSNNQGSFFNQLNISNGAFTASFKDLSSSATQYQFAVSEVVNNICFTFDAGYLQVNHQLANYTTTKSNISYAIADSSVTIPTFFTIPALADHNWVLKNTLSDTNLLGDGTMTYTYKIYNSNGLNGVLVTANFAFPYTGNDSTYYISVSPSITFINPSTNQIITYNLQAGYALNSQEYTTTVNEYWTYSNAKTLNTFNVYGTSGNPLTVFPMAFVGGQGNDGSLSINQSQIWNNKLIPDVDYTYTPSVGNSKVTGTIAYQSNPVSINENLALIATDSCNVTYNVTATPNVKVTFPQTSLLHPFIGDPTVSEQAWPSSNYPILSNNSSAPAGITYHFEILQNNQVVAGSSVTQDALAWPKNYINNLNLSAGSYVLQITPNIPFENQIITGVPATCAFKVVTYVNSMTLPTLTLTQGSSVILQGTFNPGSLLANPSQYFSSVQYFWCWGLSKNGEYFRIPKSSKTFNLTYHDLIDYSQYAFNVPETIPYFLVVNTVPYYAIDNLVFQWSGQNTSSQGIIHYVPFSVSVTNNSNVSADNKYQLVLSPNGLVTSNNPAPTVSYSITNNINLAFTGSSNTPAPNDYTLIFTPSNLGSIVWNITATETCGNQTFTYTTSYTTKITQFFVTNSNFSVSFGTPTITNSDDESQKLVVWSNNGVNYYTLPFSAIKNAEQYPSNINPNNNSGYGYAVLTQFSALWLTVPVQITDTLNLTKAQLSSFFNELNQNLNIEALANGSSQISIVSNITPNNSTSYDLVMQINPPQDYLGIFLKGVYNYNISLNWVQSTFTTTLQNFLSGINNNYKVSPNYTAPNALNLSLNIFANIYGSMTSSPIKLIGPDVNGDFTQNVYTNSLQTPGNNQPIIPGVQSQNANIDFTNTTIDYFLTDGAVPQEIVYQPENVYSSASQVIGNSTTIINNFLRSNYGWENKTLVDVTSYGSVNISSINNQDIPPFVYNWNATSGFNLAPVTESMSGTSVSANWLSAANGVKPSASNPLQPGTVPTSNSSVAPPSSWPGNFKLSYQLLNNNTRPISGSGDPTQPDWAHVQLNISLSNSSADLQYLFSQWIYTLSAQNPYNFISADTVLGAQNWYNSTGNLPNGSYMWNPNENEFAHHTLDYNADIQGVPTFSVNSQNDVIANIIYNANTFCDVPMYAPFADWNGGDPNWSWDGYHVSNYSQAVPSIANAMFLNLPIAYQPYYADGDMFGFYVGNTQINNTNYGVGVWNNQTQTNNDNGTWQAFVNWVQENYPSFNITNLPTGIEGSEAFSQNYNFITNNDEGILPLIYFNWDMGQSNNTFQFDQASGGIVTTPLSSLYGLWWSSDFNVWLPYGNIFNSTYNALASYIYNNPGNYGLNNNPNSSGAVSGWINGSSNISPAANSGWTMNTSSSYYPWLNTTNLYDWMQYVMTTEYGATPEYDLTNPNASSFSVDFSNNVLLPNGTTVTGTIFNSTYSNSLDTNFLSPNQVQTVNGGSYPTLEPLPVAIFPLPNNNE